MLIKFTSCVNYYLEMIKYLLFSVKVPVFRVKNFGMLKKRNSKKTSKKHKILKCKKLNITKNTKF